MNVLLVGSGAREHALAWKILQSPHLKKLYITPGNAGTQQLAQEKPGVVEHGTIADTDLIQLLSTAKKNHIDLAIVGPEAPLALGLSDALNAQGIQCFGPSQMAAQLETSKAFAKKFMQAHQIPTARYEIFEDSHEAIAHLKKIDYPVVIKASGLAAGKGVFLPETTAEAARVVQQLIQEKALGAAGKQIVIEERLSGQEVSLLAFSDGRAIKLMPLACDHKRLRDHDVGPNTGGMGAYAPAVLMDEKQLQYCREQILQKTVDGIREEGHAYVGVLYAGLILTEHGPKVLEFNCRFGDPETQALMLLMDDDLLMIAQACVQGRLTQEVRWHTKSAACVVLASEGYPEKSETGLTISGVEKAAAHQDVHIFMAGAKWEEEKLKTSGGRVLSVAACGEDLAHAVALAYQAVKAIHFDGMQYRHDIGRAVLATQAITSQDDAYRRAGVDIHAGTQAVNLMKDAVRSTYGTEVLAGIGAFGGMYHALNLKKMHDPVLVASTDGVGTKAELAVQFNRVRSLGHDIVNHSVNDILVQGARPLFFLDYIASAKLKPDVVADIVSGMAEACREVGCALLGGETAEMPGIYQEDKIDIAGTIVGVVERKQALPRTSALCAGDVLLGIASSGPHTNGYSLIRKVFAQRALTEFLPELGSTLADALLAPHRNYLPVIKPLLAMSRSPIKALVHLTGGGVFENIPRVLPEGLSATISLKKWPKVPLFELIKKQGGVSTGEMFRVFNMGIGMILIVSKFQVAKMKFLLGEPCWPIGKLVEGSKDVKLI